MLSTLHQLCVHSVHWPQSFLLSSGSAWAALPTARISTAFCRTATTRRHFSESLLENSGQRLNGAADGGGGFLAGTSANSSIPNEFSPQTRSRPSPAASAAGCCCCIAATGCPAGRLLRCRPTPSGCLKNLKMFVNGKSWIKVREFVDRKSAKLQTGRPYRVQWGWLGFSCVASLFVSWFQQQQRSPPDGEIKKFQSDCLTWKSDGTGVFTAWHLADVERVVVEAFDEEGDGGWWQLLVVSEQQRQEADGDVLKLPRPWRQRGG